MTTPGANLLVSSAVAVMHQGLYISWRLVCGLRTDLWGMHSARVCASMFHCARACRCDCPNHKAVNASWPGAPALPAGAFLDDYRVRMAGQFLVARPEDGVLGETAALFPAASDHHLLCLQHDDSAEMIVDGVFMLIDCLACACFLASCAFVYGAASYSAWDTRFTACL